MRQISACLACPKLREAEVEHLHCTFWRDLDIGRFQVAMDDPLLVRGLERLGNLLSDRKSVVNWNRTA